MSEPGLSGVLLFKVVGSSAVKTVRRLRQLELCLFVGGSAMVQQGGTLGVAVVVHIVRASCVLRRRMHVALTLIYI